MERMHQEIKSAARERGDKSPLLLQCTVKHADRNTLSLSLSDLYASCWISSLAASIPDPHSRANRIMSSASPWWVELPETRFIQEACPCPSRPTPAINEPKVSIYTMEIKLQAFLTVTQLKAYWHNVSVVFGIPAKESSSSNRKHLQDRPGLCKSTLM